MNNLLLVATEDGIVVCEKGSDGWQEMFSTLTGESFTCLTAAGGTILAGTADGIRRSDNACESWTEANEGLDLRHLRWMASHPELQGLHVAGTEPACIFVSRDDGRSWQGKTEVIELREEHGWYLPYSPEAGCVRGFAVSGERLYGAVEQGGVLRSDDAGRSWGLVEGSNGEPEPSPPEGNIQNDVHSIEVGPGSVERVTAATGAGLYRSEDGGASWRKLYDCYCRAIWCDPRAPRHMVLGPADGVASEGRIEETTNGGRSWSDASGGIQVPWPEHMVARFRQVGERLLAVLSDGELIAARIGAWNWERMLPEVPGITAVTALGGESTPHCSGRGRE